MIHVGHLAPRGCWDANAITQLLSNELYPTGVDFTHVDGWPQKVAGCILLVPGQYWHERAADITAAAAEYQWMLMMKTGDEEDLFDTVEQVIHPNIKHWIQTPRTDRCHRGARVFGVGWTPAFNDPPFAAHRTIDVFLSAQNTHKRRTECFVQLLDSVDATKVIHQTGGFTEGMPPDQYAKHMCAAKVAPAPSGTFSPDSFRFWEALQAHTIPIADDVSPRQDYYSTGYWRRLFPDAPFPIIGDYRDLPGYVDDQLTAWPANANRVTAWWCRQKRQWSLDLLEDLTALGAL